MTTTGLLVSYTEPTSTNSERISSRRSNLRMYQEYDSFQWLAEPDRLKNVINVITG